MSNWTNKLTELRNVLIALYPKKEDGEIMVDMVGMPYGNIAFNDRVKVNWHNILKEAIKRNKVADIVQVAVEEFPENLELQSIYKEVEENEPMTSTSNLYGDVYGAYLKELSKRAKPQFRGGATDDISEKINVKYEELYKANADLKEGVLDKVSYRSISDSINESVSDLIRGSNLEVIQPEFETSSPISRGVQNYDVLVPSRKGLEKVIGSDDIVDLITWIEKAKESSLAVCKIETSTGESGTGFLLKGGYLMTNNHVIPSTEVAKNTRLVFNYIIDKDKNVEEQAVYSLDPSIFYTSHEDELDYTVVKVLDSDDEPLSKWGNVEIESFFDPNVNEKVTIIQHPNGNYMKMAFPDNIISVWGKYLFYITDTKEGSSGSPVFNKSWKVVALHHAGKNESSPEGGMQINEAGDMKASNRGILIKEILANLKDQGFTHNIT